MIEAFIILNMFFKVHHGDGFNKQADCNSFAWEEDVLNISRKMFFEPHSVIAKSFYH